MKQFLSMLKDEESWRKLVEIAEEKYGNLPMLLILSMRNIQQYTAPKILNLNFIIEETSTTLPYKQWWTLNQNFVYIDERRQARISDEVAFTNAVLKAASVNCFLHLPPLILLSESLDGIRELIMHSHSQHV